VTATHLLAGRFYQRCSGWTNAYSRNAYPRKIAYSRKMPGSLARERTPFKTASINPRWRPLLL
jgi:hypothetical protein